MTKDQPLLRVRDLQIQRINSSGSSTIVRSASLDIAEGEVFALVGPSGSGKSLIALSLVGLLPEHIHVTGGEVQLQDTPVPVHEPGEMQPFRSKKIGYCSASTIGLSRSHTIGWHLGMTWRLTTGNCHPLAFARRAPRGYLEKLLQAVQVPSTDEMLRAFPHQLPVGTQQRIKLALAWAARPQLLIVDNPLQDLDPGSTAQLLGSLRSSAQANHSAVLLIAHDVGLVAELADRVGVLHCETTAETTSGTIGSSIVEMGTPKRIFASPQHKYTKRWLVASSLPTPPADKDQSAPGRPIIRGVRVSKFYRVAQRVWAPPSLSRALRGISFAVYPGQSLGIVGESGSGKSTLARLLLRLTEPSLGRILVDEQNVSAEGAQESLRRGIQFVLQDAMETLNPRLTVQAAVAEPLIVHNKSQTHRKTRARVENVLLDVGYPIEQMQRKISHLSCGQAQQVALARSLCLRPRLLVLDEPISGLAPPQRRHITDTLARECRTHDLGAIILSQDLPLLLQACSRILVLHAGSIVESGPCSALARNARHPYTRALFAALPSRKPGKPRLRHIPEATAPSPFQPIVGCGYFSRCPQSSSICQQERPQLVPLRPNGDHEVACWNPQDRVGTARRTPGQKLSLVPPDYLT